MCTMNVLYCQMLTLSSYPKEVPVKVTVFKKTKTCASLAFHSALTRRRHAWPGESSEAQNSASAVWAVTDPICRDSRVDSQMVEQVKVDLNVGLNE